MIHLSKSILQNLLLAAVSLSVSLLALELVSRLVLEPVDFLRPQLIDDPIMGHAIRPRSGGHDQWGFRNRSVPERAAIVAIGDSQTYGASATAKDAWPLVLGELSKQSVYNLSLGGYGPAQYFYLLTSKAVKLNPEIVIVGFYLGNDLLETYELVQNNPHWMRLKGAGYSFDHNFDATEAAPPREESASFVGNVRTWLARRSVLYNVVIHSALGEIARVAEAMLVSSQQRGHIRYDKNGIHTGFTPELRLKALDLQDPRVNEGFIVSLDLFARMNTYCLERAIDLVVVLIPTKESVHAVYLENDPSIEGAAEIRPLLANERRVTQRSKAFFEDHGIAYVDLLPVLQEHVGRRQLYPGNFDGHPNRNGNRVIAEKLERHIRERTPEPLTRGLEQQSAY